MKKILLLSAVACSMVFYACKKDSDTDTTTPVPEDTIVAPAIDPIALASTVKIGYGGSSVKGEFPATTTAAETPVLDSNYNGRIYNTVNNRYVVIYPRVSSGFISGYYLKINGADSYFKIDYASAYGVRKAKPKNAGARDEVNNYDSSIVIKLPAGLKGDTFSIKYAAYDSLNHVSNPISATVNVIASADSTNDALLLGNWRYTAYKYAENGEWYAYRERDTLYPTKFTCTDDKLTYTRDFSNIIIYNVITYYPHYMQFSAQNAYNEINSYTDSDLNLELSSCSNYVYTPYNQGSYTYYGGYSYNATTRVLTLIEDENGTGDYIETQKYTVKEITSTKLVMYQAEDDGYHNQLEFNYSEYTKIN